MAELVRAAFDGHCFIFFLFRRFLNKYNLFQIKAILNVYFGILYFTLSLPKVKLLATF